MMARLDRNEHERICLIVNPRSAGGATGRRLNAIRDAAGRRFASWEVRLTERTGHASELAAQAAEDGFDIVASVGGDGTANEVVNGLFVGDVAREGVRFTVIPGGTGSDLIRSLRIPKDLDAAMQVAATGADRPTDVVAVEMDRADGEGRVRRLAINVTGFGLNGAIVTAVNDSSKRWGGTLTFLGATVKSLSKWVAPQTTVRWTDETGVERSWDGRLFNVFIANGHYCGGGMLVGRGGSMQDGLLDLTIIPELPITVIGRSMHRLYTGTMSEVPGVIRATAREVDARAIDAKEPVRLDVDGEQPGVLPANAKVLPGALVVRALW